MNLLDLLYIPVAAVTAPWWATKKRAGWKERFGHVEGLTPLRDGFPRGRILLHAVSVGEVAALRHVVPLLAPRADIVISVSTDTGIARARELFGAVEGCSVVRYPLDFSWAVRRFLDAVQPKVAALVELEVWPNFVGACVKRNIPVCIINGRLSARSAKGYGRIRPFFARVLRTLSWAAVQDDEYAARFVHLGLPADRLRVTGSMKWDAARIEDAVAGDSTLAAELGIDLTKPLIVAGSTGPGEEALLHEACPAGVQLLCAPRKPERFDEAAAALGSGVVRRTRHRGVHASSTGATRFLLDTIGELRAAYSLATVVVVGRSFGDQYGSDPIEPAALGKPVVIGPAVSDFSQIVDALRGGGGLVQVGREQLAATLARLVGSEAERAATAAAARRVIRGQQGASARHAEMLLQELDRALEAAGSGR